ncbi:MAG: Uma2 family endonuclease [Chloroflexota bacterium]
MMTIQEKWISIEEFREITHLPENADKHMDLIEGVIYTMPPAGEEHGSDAGNFFGFIWNHARANDLGRVTAAETGYIVHTDENGKVSLLAPDVGFIAKARATAEPSRKYVPFAPDLAVEMVSPHDTAEEIHLKVNKYLQYGTHIVWVAYPETRTVVVHTASGAHTLSENDILEGGDVLPGFKLRVGEIFAV